MKEYLLVGFGGMVGSMARYASGSYFMRIFPDAKFPWGTFFVNILGCFLIGVLAGLAAKFTATSAEIRLAGIVGLLGGFTTFSAFGFETLQLVKNGQANTAILYAIASVILGLFSVYIGLKISA